jgi:hypothetical protein
VFLPGLFGPETVFDALVMTLLAGRIPDELNEESFTRMFYTVMEHAGQFSPHRFSSIWFHRIHERTLGRTVILSGQGFLGLAPKATEVDDLIYYMKVCYAPIVLRKLDDGSFSWIGDAYVHTRIDDRDRIRDELESTTSEITIC